MKLSILILSVILFPLLISSLVSAAVIPVMAVNPVKATNLDPDSVLLLTAAQESDTETLGRLIAEQVPIDAKDDYGRTALHVAAEYGHAAVAALLIEAGANIEARTNSAIHTYWQYTPLMITANWGRTNITKRPQHNRRF